MEVVDLSQDREPLFAVCLEDWSDDARQAGPKRSQWVSRCRAERGLRVKVALDDEGSEGGMIQYSPIEHTTVLGTGLYFIHCIHVHGHSQGRGDFRGHGMGTALLEAAEQDSRGLGAEGMAAWGVRLPFWMRSAWFRKHGYRTADRQGLSALVWKPFTEDARPPRWPRVRPHLPEPVEGKVNVVSFSSGWCMALNLTHERARHVSAEFGDAVAFHEIDTSSPEAFAQWGVQDALFIDGKKFRSGPPPSLESLHRAVAKRAARL
jgi:GNAT superfamily N-acetyltransferase